MSSSIQPVSHQLSQSSFFPASENLLQNQEIDQAGAYNIWNSSFRNATVITLGNRENRITATSGNAMRALIAALNANRIENLDVTGIRFTPETLGIFFFHITSTSVKSLKITIDDAPFLQNFADQIFLSKITELCLILEKGDERYSLVDSLNRLLQNAPLLEAFEIANWSLTDEELARVFQNNAPNLAFLSLGKNKLTEKTLHYLASEQNALLQQAFSLDFSDNQIQAIPKEFLISAAKPGLILNLRNNLLSQEQVEAFFSALPKRNRDLEMDISLFPQKVQLPFSLPQRLKYRLTPNQPAAPEPNDSYARLFKKQFKVTNTFCHIGDNLVPLSSEMIRSLLFHYFQGKRVSEGDEQKALGHIFTKNGNTALLMPPYDPPPAKDSFASIITDEALTPSNASLRFWKLPTKEEGVLDLDGPFTSVPAVLGLIELLSYPDSPIKELILGPEISDPCWEALMAHLPLVQSLKALNLPEISAKRLQDLAAHGKSLLSRVEYADFSGEPERGFLEALLPIVELAPLKYLDLSGRKIGDEGTIRLLQLKQPEYLSLNDNNITDEGFENLCETYGKTGNLKELELDENPITTPLPLLFLHHLQPLTVSMPNVRISSAEIIVYYDLLLMARKESYIDLVKHEFRYHLYSLNALAAILARQHLLNVKGDKRPLPLFPGTEEIQPHLETMNVLYGKSEYTGRDIQFINGNPNNNYLIAHLLSIVYTPQSTPATLLDILAQEMGIDKKELSERLEQAADAPHLDQEERYLLGLKKLDPFPVFVYHKNSQFVITNGSLHPAGEFTTLHYAILLYRTQEGRYYLLK